MKTVSISKFKWLFALLVGSAVTAFGQKYTKSYNEHFSVNDDVTIAVNTSYTDVEFETWNKDEVEIEARIEVEGISDEEAEAYVRGWDFEAMGNSGKVTVTAASGPALFPGKRGKAVLAPGNMDFNFEMPEFKRLKELEKLSEMEPVVVELAELEQMPPMPPIPFEDFGSFSFDYEAYKEDGEEYLEKWKKEFTENFEKNFKPRFEAWKKQMEAHKKDMNRYKMQAKIHKGELREMQEKHQQKMEKMQKSLMEAEKKARAAAEEERKANVFYFREGSEDKNIKVKKTIRIKMPKGARLKMDIRHGEVKLAENFKNIKATLSHTRLLAAEVDGAQTHIEASFSPVQVEYWNRGKLKVNYVKDVALKHVKSVELSSTSSDVIIGNIADTALIEGSFNTLKIENVSNNFKNLKFILDNSDAVIVLPKSAFDFYFTTSNTKIDLPRKLNIAATHPSGQLIEGWHKQKNSNRNINLTATYSDVVIR